MDIIIKMMNGTSHTLTVDPRDTVGSLKNLIQQELGVPPEKQKLRAQRTQLSDDSKPVGHYVSQPGSQVSLLVTEPDTIQVFLSNANGKTSTYKIKPDETVRVFKSRVEAREGVEVSQQNLVYEGKMMMDERKLADYNIRKNTTIYLTLQLRGGFHMLQI